MQKYIAVKEFVFDGKPYDIEDVTMAVGQICTGHPLEPGPFSEPGDAPQMIVGFDVIESDGTNYFAEMMVPADCVELYNG